MLVINDTYYSAEDFDKKYTVFRKNKVLSDKKKNRIAVCLEDSATWLALCLYLKEKSISVMPIHPSTPLHAAERIAKKANCHVLYYHTLEIFTVLHEKALEAQDPGLIQMSSGTTGEPKCINRSWKSIDTEINSYTTTFSKPQEMTPVIACPITHSYGLISGVMVALARKQTPIIVNNINPKFLIKTLKKCDRPLLYTSPTMLEGLMRLWPKGSQLHAIMTSGTIMSRSVFEKISPHINHMFQQYGCSEAGCITINQNMTTNNDIGTPLSHIKLSSGKSIDSPEEIIATINTSSSELEKVKHIVHTQDIGYMQLNENGQLSLHFIARLDDTIIVAGLNVYPQDIEDVVLTHPDVTDAVAFKIEDPYAGQRICLHYTSNRVLDTHYVRSLCRLHLANHQIPQILKQVNTIERMPNGKISRKKLTDAFHQEKALKENATKDFADSAA